jgi:hypothetical protein
VGEPVPTAPPPAKPAGAAPGTEAASVEPPLTLGQAAARHGAYRWIEQRLFELTGAWSADQALGSALQVHLFAASAQHAAHAVRWYDRLPVLATVDRDALTKPLGPALGPLVARLEEGAPEWPPGAGGAGSRARGGASQNGPPAASQDAPVAGVQFVAGLYRVVLPGLVASYRAHLLRLSPVADEPSRQTVAEVLRAEEAELATAARLLELDDRFTPGLEAGVAALARVLDGTREAEGATEEAVFDDLVPWSDTHCTW